MINNSRNTWAFRLDKWCAIIGALVPVGLVIGNVGFELAVALVGIFWITRCIIMRHNPMQYLFTHPLVLPWAAWYLCIITSLLFNGAGSKGWAHDLVFIRYFLYILALFDVSRRQPVTKYLLNGLIAGIIWAGINTISAYVLGYDIIGKPLTRYTGKLKEAARISCMSVYAASFLLAWGILDKSLLKRKKTFIISVGLIAIGLVIQTNVRTATFASIAGIFTFIMLYFVQQYKARYVVAVLIVFLVAITGISIEKIKTIGNISSMYDRFCIWKVVWAMFINHPFLGVGISSFQDMYTQLATSGDFGSLVYSDGRIWSTTDATHAHNIILMILSCTGLFGLVTFFWLIGNSIYLILKNLHHHFLGLVTWPVVLFVLGLTGWNIFHSWYQALFAFFIALIGSTNKRSLTEGK